MTTNVEKVRALIRDPEGGTPEISTTDIETLLEVHSNRVKPTAAAAALNIAAKYAAKKDISGGGASVKNSQHFQHWMSLARALGAKGTVTTGPALSGVSQREMAAVGADSDRVPSRIG